MFTQNKTVLGHGRRAAIQQREPVHRVLVALVERRERHLVALLHAGEEGVLGFLVGQVMKETGGKADPKVVNRLLRDKLQP